MADWGKIIRREVNLKELNTMKINCKAEYYSAPENLDELKSVLDFSKKRKLKTFILGNGSNVIFSKPYLENMIIIDMKNFNKIRTISSEIIEVEAGVLSKDLINFAIKNGLSGIEFLAGIPGTFGGMIKMNAGAFGHSISEVVKEISVFDINLMKIKRKKDLKFGYRKFKNLKDEIILSGVITLKKSIPEMIKDKVKEFLMIRREKQPNGFSAGSIFKNPEGRFAGRIIEECGLKGLSVNDAFVSDKHANFIINRGNASGRDVVELIKKIKDEVFKKKGIKLEEEVIIV